MNVGEWRGKFSTFIQETSYRPRYVASRPPQKTSNEKEVVETHQLISEEVLKLHWGSFVMQLEKEGKSYLVSHLQMCELVSIQNGLINLKCIKKFSYETLQSELSALIDEAKLFFGGVVEIEIVLDKSGLAKATKMERGTLEVFNDLAKTNDVIKYLIDHFGAEPLY